MTLPVQMDQPAPTMTVPVFKEWERRQMLACPEWTPIPVVPGDRVEINSIDGVVHTILIVEDDEDLAAVRAVVAGVNSGRNGPQ